MVTEASFWNNRRAVAVFYLQCDAARLALYAKQSAFRITIKRDLKEFPIRFVFRPFQNAVDQFNTERFGHPLAVTNDLPERKSVHIDRLIAAAGGNGAGGVDNGAVHVDFAPPLRGGSCIAGRKRQRRQKNGTRSIPW